MRILTMKSEILTRGVESIVTVDELSQLFGRKKQIRIKHGIDATSPELHIGHAASLWKMRALQELGHKAIILLGDVTTSIGDPTGRTEARPALSRRVISQNIKAIDKQIRSILLTDARVFELHLSSEWYSKMKLADFLTLFSSVTHARLIERDMFQKRIAKGQEIYMHELMYPVFQGYDSVALRSDLTIIGSDQLFNEHLGRFFQEKAGQTPQVIVALKILPGLRGEEKMSKSSANFIGINDSPQDKFGKAMSVPDSLIISYLEVYTDFPTEKISGLKKKLETGLNPKEAKLVLAQALVQRYHGRAAGESEKKKFINLFSERELPADIPMVDIAYGLYDASTLIYKIGAVPSKSEARRLVSQNAVRVSGDTIGPNDHVMVSRGLVVRVGKRRFFKVR